MQRRNFIHVSLKGAALIASWSMLSCDFSKQSQPKNTFKNNELELKGDELISYIKEFTDTHRRYAGDYYGRELACSRVQLKAYLCSLRDEDIFVGRNCLPPVGVSPQLGFLYYCDFNYLKKLKNADGMIPENQALLQEISDYWKNEDGLIISRRSFSESLAAVLPSDNWSGQPGIGFPLYRIAGTTLDYDKLLTLGLPGMKKLIEERNRSTSDQQAKQLYAAMLDMLGIVRESIDLYLEQVSKALKVTIEAKRKVQLKKLADNLSHIKDNPPATLYQGVQLMYLYCVLSGSLNYGRMDDYLCDLYIKDKAKGVTDEEQITVLQHFWDLIQAHPSSEQRVFVGGKGRRDEVKADQLASIIMESVFRSRLIIPQLSLRFHKGQNPGLYAKALDMIGQSYPFPILYNDDAIIPALMKAFRVNEKEAEQYVTTACGETSINHCSLATPNGLINLLQALLVTLNNGVDPATGKKQGLALGSDFPEYDDLFAAYRKQVEYYVDALTVQQKLVFDVAGETMPFLLFSMLYDDCIERGKPLFKGGMAYLSGFIETYGNTNTGDSLAAIKYWVYDKKEYTLDQVRKALSENFEGYEEMRKRLLDAPKYGNDDDYADDILVAVDNHIFNYVLDAAEKVGLDFYIIDIINVDANTTLGRQTPASPDGRLANTYLANANSPTGGADKSGITAMLNSIVKPGVFQAVQHMKFSKEWFGTEKRPILEALLTTYWANGGPQAMINVLGRNDLENALKEPDKYQNLIVRVGGFSARFIDLAPEVQKEILSRTLY